MRGKDCLRMFGAASSRNPKQYPEDPAEFRPLTEDELARIKKERRQKEVQRKQKAAENRKHLANVRVVQKNLVFVVGLSQRLADVETLKKHEYFGKFGKIHKVVINQSTSYAGAQGPSASAYVTYNRPEDALRAIQAVNNIHVEGRTLKASLGTTKYCSHFLRGAQCPKPDCMYLHELGEEAASFTKEEMQQGKHQEYEQKLYEMCMNASNLANPGSGSSSPGGTNSSSGSMSGKVTPLMPPGAPESPPQPIQQPTQPNRKKTESPTELDGEEHSPPIHSGKEVWPVLNNPKPERLTNGNKSSKLETHNGQNRAPGHHRSSHSHSDTSTNSQSSHMNGSPTSSIQQLSHSVSPPLSSNTQAYSSTQQIGMGHQTTQLHNNTQMVPQTQHSPLGGTTPKRSPFENPVDSMSLFSSTNGFPSSRNPKPIQNSQPADSVPTTTEIPDTIPVSSSTDWQAAFGFTPIDNCQNDDTKDDDLGFDPWDESAKALADLIESESVSGPYHKQQAAPPLHLAGHLAGGQASQHYADQNRPKTLPPGFNANHLGAFPTNNPLNLSGSGGSKMLGLMQIPPSVGPSNFNLPPNNTYHDVLSDISLTGKPDNITGPQNHDVFNTKDWQDGLRALLPNINIGFGAPNHQVSQMAPPVTHSRAPPQHPHTSYLQKNSSVEEPPHWMASLQHLTEESHHNHRMPFVHQFQLRGSTGGSWGQPATSPTQPPPPGFHQSQLRHHPHQMAPEAQKLTEGLQ